MMMMMRQGPAASELYRISVFHYFIFKCRLTFDTLLKFRNDRKEVQMKCSLADAVIVIQVKGEHAPTQEVKCFSSPAVPGHGKVYP